ncbi:MAG: hypothetical protein H8Z69_04590 [Nanohaloarchaea archaeon]|nr:hypothetical protein [Candidatus Nanohaloarchaea archaeon]
MDENEVWRVELDQIANNEQIKPRTYAEEIGVDYSETVLSSLEDQYLSIFETAEGPFLFNASRMECYNFEPTKSGLEEAAYKLAANDDGLLEDSGVEEPGQEWDYVGQKGSADGKVREMVAAGNFMIYNQDNSEEWLQIEEPAELDKRR